jgi:uncharacterized protein (DUF1800 family)
MELPVLTLPVNENKTAEKKPFRTLSGLAEYAGTWGTSEITHLLKRTMFGAAPADIKYFKTRTMVQAVDELMNNSFAPSTQPVNDYNDDMYTDPSVPLGQTWINAPYDSDADFRRIYSFKKWQLMQMKGQGRSVQMKMMLFWHNHFATHIGDLGISKMFYDHNVLLRNYAVGNFKTLTKLISTDCIMLRYLTGEYNTKWEPNENYARELQELFCIGKGAGAQFTEDDVKTAARVLTGWKVDYDNNSAYFLQDDHDTDDKIFSSFYNNKVITGRNTATAGADELEDLLDMLFANNECALYICRRLYRWFVYYDIDAATEANVIVPLANILRSNNYEIKPVLKTLFKSEHFYDVVNYGAQIKSPLDFILGLFREFNVQFPPASDFMANYKLMDTVNYFSYIMNQEYGDPPNVAGWPAYYQSPQFYEIWLNASTYPKRVDFSKWLVEYGIEREGNLINVDVIAFAKATSSPSNPNTLINDSLDILYRLPISSVSKATLKKGTLLDGQANDAYWTSAWNAHIAAPNDAIKKSVVESRLKNLYRYLVNSPEFQLV